MVVLAPDEVGGDIAGCPRCEEGRCTGTELVQQVAELCALGRVEERTGHTAGVYRDPVLGTRAALETAHLTWSSPSLARNLYRTSSSARAYRVARSAGSGDPDR